MVTYSILIDVLEMNTLKYFVIKGGFRVKRFVFYILLRDI